MTGSAHPVHGAVHAPLTPVFIGLRIGLHATFVALVAYVVVRAIIAPGPRGSWIVALGLVLFAFYMCGAFVARSARSAVVPATWLALLTALVLVLLLLTPDATFLAFPLFFLQLHVVPFRWGVPAVAMTTAVAIVGVAVNSGWSPGGVLGPLIGATVAVVMGLGYRALYREAQQRQRLIDELVQTRAELAAREHESGVLQERSRLAREIHDTVAQGLSSIQMLLHASERESDADIALQHLRLARDTAGTNLAEARRFIRELTPPALEQQTLAGALARLAESSSDGQVAVSFHASGESLPLPMRVEAALLRIAQAALANVIQHAGASRAEVTLSYLDDWIGLDVVDDGRGFLPASLGTASSARASFGLIAMRQRVEQLGGSLTVESHPGSGTAIAVGLPLPEAAP